jgi:hypothetical protein
MPSGEARAKLIDRPGVVAAALGLLIGGLCSSPGRAQEPARSGEPPHVILGTVSSDRGTTASIPLFYQPVAGQSVRSLHLEVQFGNAVQFVSGQKGSASEAQDFDLAVKAAEGRLSIDVALQDADAGKALPEGQLASLDFRVPEDATAGSVPLVPAAVSAQDASKKQVKVIAEEGMIVIVTAPPVACFFYMH